jgi:hypothetical protein
MTRFYFFISLILHPIWIPTWVLIFWFKEFLSFRIDFFSSTFATFLGHELAFITFIPGLVTLSTKIAKKTDWEMNDVSTRFWPFLIGSIFWIGYTINLGRELGKMSDLIWLSTGAGGISLLVLSFCYFKKIKLSAHSAGWATLLPLFTLNKNLPNEIRLIALMVSTIILGVVIGIRWISGAHQAFELIGGVLIGIISSTGFIYFVQ